MKLIAKWKSGLEPAYDEPSSVRWEDGTPATLDDYRTHALDTHSLHASDDGGMECHMFPETVANVQYSKPIASWVLSGQGITSTSLELVDPDATDDQILEELFTFPVIYRARIHR